MLYFAVECEIIRPKVLSTQRNLFQIQKHLHTPQKRTKLTEIKIFHIFCLPMLIEIATHSIHLNIQRFIFCSTRGWPLRKRCAQRLCKGLPTTKNILSWTLCDIVSCLYFFLSNKQFSRSSSSFATKILKLTSRVTYKVDPPDHWRITTRIWTWMLASEMTPRYLSRVKIDVKCWIDNWAVKASSENNECVSLPSLMFCALADIIALNLPVW